MINWHGKQERICTTAVCAEGMRKGMVLWVGGSVMGGWADGRAKLVCFYICNVTATTTPARALNRKGAGKSKHHAALRPCVSACRAYAARIAEDIHSIYSNHFKFWTLEPFLVPARETRSEQVSNYYARLVHASQVRGSQKAKREETARYKPRPWCYIFLRPLCFLNVLPYGCWQRWRDFFFFFFFATG